MPYGGKLHIPPTIYHLLAAQQEPYKKAYVLMKNIGESSGKVRSRDHFQKQWQDRKKERRDRKGESNDSSEIPDMQETQDIPGLLGFFPRGDQNKHHTYRDKNQHTTHVKVIKLIMSYTDQEHQTNNNNKISHKCRDQNNWDFRFFYVFFFKSENAHWFDTEHENWIHKRPCD